MKDPFKKRNKRVKKSAKKVVRPKGLKEDPSKHTKKGGYRELIRGAKKGRGVYFKGKKVYGG